MHADRIRDFRRRLELGVADRVVETAHGRAFLADSTPQVYDHNYLVVERAGAGAAELAAEAEEAMADRLHRRVVVDHDEPGLTDEFLSLGYVRSTHLVLEHHRRPDRLVDTSMVREVPLDDLLPARTEAILREPWGDERIAPELNEAKRQTAAAVPTRFFAAVAAGEVAGWCELRTDDGVAQIEDVEVLPRFRGRGLGRAVVQHALEVATRAADVVWLEALADDWPRELYAKLGFDLVGRRDLFTRLPPPAARLLLRTPRLELRLPTAAELRALYRVAAAGIHDPEVMPFEVAWTDTLEEESFLAYHRAPTRDRLELVAFLDGAPIGVQGLTIRLPEVATGSWLGRPFQNGGLGTEMRAAVLTLAFDHLGARVARSGWLAGNRQSEAVSRKLGYARAGSHTVAPRGVPVDHVDVELTPERFTSPVPVEVWGAEQLRAALP